MVLLTVLSKLYKELHSVIQNSPELSTQFPSLAAAHTDLITAAVSASPGPIHKTGSEPGITVLGPAPELTLRQKAAAEGSPVAAGHSSPQKPLIAKALQMTGKRATKGRILNVQKVAGVHYGCVSQAMYTAPCTDVDACTHSVSWTTPACLPHALQNQQVHG